MPLYGDSPSTFSSHAPVLDRHLEGLTALLLSLKKRPIVRYERMSPMARRLGQDLVAQMNDAQSDLWEFRRTATAPLLLILDRRNDPVTPLLTQWTYQAMVHELLGITNGRVSLEDVPEVRDELKVRSLLHQSPKEFTLTHVRNSYVDRRLSCRQSKIPFLPTTCTTTLATSELISRRTCKTTRLDL